MPRFEIDVDPCDHLTADAIGAPGQRVFYIHAWQAAKTVTIIIEKIQLQTLAVGIERFLADLARQHPELDQASTDYVEEKMRINPPVEPIFRAGEIGLGYDREKDMVIIVTREILLENQEPEDAAVIRFWCTRHQAQALARWGQDVVQRGRPICPQCSEAMEPEGHFCPKKNGYLR